VSVENIKDDLTVGKNRPQWIFSAYAPSKEVPRLLFGGPHRERSMEEMRLRHYELAAAGNLNEAVQEASSLWEECVKQTDAALNDPQGAANYVIDGKNEHPNLFDIIQGKTNVSSNQGPTPFGQPSAPSQPSPFGQQNTNVAPNAAPAPGAFGAPSSTFGQTTGIGQSSGFGRASAPAQATAFGQPSGFGQTSSLGGSGFGQPSALGGQSALNKAPFGQPVANSNPFGKPSGLGGAAPFGAPSAASPFAQIPQNQSAGGGFSSGPSGPSPFGQGVAQNTASPFGQNPAQQPAVPFGAPSAPGGFGQPSQVQPPQPSPFQSANSNPFGASAQQAPAPSPFGAPSQQPSVPSPFGQPPVAQGVPVQNTNAGPNAFMKTDIPQELNPLPQLQGETRHDPQTKKLTTWKGRTVNYINEHPCYLHPQDNKTFVRINFPNGPPDAASLRDSQGKPEEYTPEVVEAYQFFLQNGHFKDGKIPAVPPQREWISFDF
jgi:nucleoporin NUP42